MKGPFTIELAAKLVREYLCINQDLIQTMAVCPDPCVKSTYAIRAIMLDGEVFDFLLIGDEVPNQPTSDDIEEVEFKTWPPDTNKKPTCFVMHLR